MTTEIDMQSAEVKRFEALSSFVLRQQEQGNISDKDLGQILDAAHVAKLSDDITPAHYIQSAHNMLRALGQLNNELLLQFQQTQSNNIER